MKGIAIGADRLESVEFEGTIFVNTNKDNDWIGSVFSFQVENHNFLFGIIVFFKDTSNFYLLMSAKSGSRQGSWQIKRIHSITGPVGTNISAAVQ